MNYYELEKMNRDQIIDILKALSASYTPEWKFDESEADVGSALMQIYADMFHETVQKASQMPNKHFVDFINLLNPMLKPSRGARGYVTFTLSEGTKEGIAVQKGKQLIGESELEDTLIFETTEDILIAPTALENILLVKASTDEITVQNSYPFFVMPEIIDNNLQCHQLKIIHSNALNLKNAKNIEIILKDRESDIRLKETLKILSCSKWFYFKGEKWIEFDNCIATENSVVLTNNKSIDIELPEIRLILDRAEKIICSRLLIKPNGNSVKPDVIYNNEIELSKDDFLMFGTQFHAYDSFYIASNEIFSKDKSEITIDFECILKQYNTPYEIPSPNIRWKNVLKKNDLKEPEEKRIYISDLVLEYWNGTGWSKIEASKFDRKMFASDINEPFQVKVKFLCPSDIKPTTVGAFENYWIRIKILKVENSYSPLGKYYAPVARSFNISYSYQNDGVMPEILERHEFMEKTLIDSSSASLTLFSDYGDLNKDAIYLQFNKLIKSGPFKILFEVDTVIGDKKPVYKWQILVENAGRSKWKDLDVLDDTYSLTETGIVTFIGDENHANKAMFGIDGYWLRAIQVHKGTFPVKINDVRINSVDITQKRTVQLKYFTLGQHEYNKIINLDCVNLEGLELWVNEKNVGINKLDNEGITYDKDLSSDGILEAAWVKWKAYESFELMNKNTRGYVADFYNGTIQFGNTINGYLPVGNLENNVKALLSLNYGQHGNIDAGQITRLAQSIPNVNMVFNSIASQGGHSPESQSDALKRISETIYHRNRIRSTRDFDLIILEADYDIKEVVTLKNTNSSGNREMGYVTSVILPKTQGYNQDYFRRLKNRIKDHILNKLPCTLLFDKNYFIIEPKYVSIDVHVKCQVNDMENYLLTYSCVENLINSYLDVFSGNKDGLGWKIGDLPDYKYLQSSLQRIDAITSIDLLVLSARVKEGYNQREISITDLAKFPHIVIENGQHTISLIV